MRLLITDRGIKENLSSPPIIHRNVLLHSCRVSLIHSVKTDPRNSFPRSTIHNSIMSLNSTAFGIQTYRCIDCTQNECWNSNLSLIISTEHELRNFSSASSSTSSIYAMKFSMNSDLENDFNFDRRRHCKFKPMS